jgi:hypothetical protein
MADDRDDDYLARVRSAADAEEEAREAWVMAKERRDEAIVAAKDEGHLSNSKIAHAARRATSRVVAILGTGA